MDKARRLQKTLTELFDENEPTAVLQLNRDRENSADVLKIGDSIVAYQNSIGIEVGSGRRGHRIHAHVLMQIEHTTSLQVNVDAIKRYVASENEDWIPPHKANPDEPWKAVYVQVKMVDESSKRILNYIWKGAPVATEDIVDVANTIYNTANRFQSLSLR